MLLFSVQGRRTALMFSAPSPSMSHRKTISRSLVFSFLFSVCAFAQTPPDSDARHHPAQPAPAPTDHEQILAYWTTETGWHSELQLRNNQMSGDLIVTPALRTTNGVETKLSPVTVKPQEVKVVDLDAAIGTSAPQLVGTYGSLVLRYHSRGYRNLYAALMVRNIGHPFAFHIDASGESEGYQAGSREGVWWLPKDTTNDYLILTNQGNDTVPVDLSLYDASGKEVEQKVTLGPRETTRYSVRKLILAGGLTGTYGGIKVSAAHAGSLDTLHFLFDETAGFSATLKMFDHDPNTKVAERDYARTAVWTLRAPMLALTNPDPALAFPPTTTLRPQLFIRNTMGTAVNTALRFRWRSGSATGKADGPALRLNPYETRRIDVAALQDGSVLPKQANWASVTLTTNGQPDEVMAVAASYDDTLRFGAQTPFSDQLTFKWEGGMWEFDPQHNSIITAGNGGTKPTQAALTIYYNQGTERYDLEQTLQPDEQMWIDVGKLIREHVQDKNGKTLPDNLTSGSYEFRDLTDKAVGSLFEGKVIYDKTYGHVAYGCATCCSYSRWTENYNPMLLTVGNSAQNGVSAYELCFNGFTDISAWFYKGWNTSNHAIATVNNAFGTGGTTTAVGVGTTAENTSGLLMTGQQRNCPSFLVGVPGSTIVVPNFSVGYKAYIAVDHITSATSCLYAGTFNTPYIYIGDANRTTYRATEQLQVIPDLQQSSNFFNDIGESRNYGAGSPANGSTLSSLDEDGIANDCYLWNNAKKTPQPTTYDVTYPFAHQGQVHYVGSVYNSLESSAATITWDMRTVLDTTNPQSPTAYVNYNHTCYPAHQITVNGAVVYSYTPPSDAPQQLLNCLVFHDFKLVGQTQPMVVPTH
jgi:hypothetical protein